MKTDFFKSQPERLALLERAAESWLGTPFRQGTAVRGLAGGVDCVSFIAQVFLEIGAVTQEIAVPPYDLRYGRYADESLLRNWFEQPGVKARVRLLDEAEPHLDGDMIFPKVGKIEHHLGLRIRNFAFHVVCPQGVVRQPIGFLKLHRSRYRLTE